MVAFATAGASDIFVVPTVILLGAVYLTGVKMYHDVLPRLSAEDQEYFRSSLRKAGTWRFDIALHKLWDEHCRLFPQSHLRQLVVVFLGGMLLSVFAYPLKLILVP